MKLLFKLLLAIAPLLLAVLFAWLVMEGHLNFGSGEKEIFLAIPVLLWAFAYLCCYLVLWWRGSELGRCVGLSSGLATGFVVSAWLLLLFVLLLKSG